MFSKGKSRRSNYHSKRQTFNPNTKTYGTLPIHKSNFDKNHHPNIVVEKNRKKWLSVGIQSASKNGHHKLAKVYESHGEVGYLQHHVNERKPSDYKATAENWHIDKVSEAKAKSMVDNYKQKNKH